MVKHVSNGSSRDVTISNNVMLLTLAVESHIIDGAEDWWLGTNAKAPLEPQLTKEASMASSSPSNVSEWIALVDATEEVRTAEMKRRYQELAGLSEEERVKHLVEMARGEHEMIEEKLHAFTKSRLLVWIDMDEEQAKKVAHSYDAAVQTLPGTLAMRRVGAVQTVARTFAVSQIDRLHAVIPSIVREMPRVVVSSLSTDHLSAKKKAWWKFW